MSRRVKKKKKSGKEPAAGIESRLYPENSKSCWEPKDCVCLNVFLGSSLFCFPHTHWDREARGNDKYVAERNLGQLCWNRCYWEFPDPWNSFAGVITRRSRLQKHRHTHTHTHYRNAYSYIKSSVFFFLCLLTTVALHKTEKIERAWGSIRTSRRRSGWNLPRATRRSANPNSRTVRPLRLPLTPRCCTLSPAVSICFRFSFTSSFYPEIVVTLHPSLVTIFFLPNNSHLVKKKPYCRRWKYLINPRCHGPQFLTRSQRHVRTIRQVFSCIVYTSV